MEVFGCSFYNNGRVFGAVVTARFERARIFGSRQAYIQVD